MLWICVRDTNLHETDVRTDLIKNIVCAFLTETGERLPGFTQPAGLMPFQASCPANQWEMLHLPVGFGVLHKQ